MIRHLAAVAVSAMVVLSSTAALTQDEPVSGKLPFSWPTECKPGRPPQSPEFPFDRESAERYQKDYAGWAGLPLTFKTVAGIELRLIPPGTFPMGSHETESGHGEQPWDETQHPVWLTRPFYLSTAETTVRQFREFVESRNYVTDGEKNGGGHAHDAIAVWKNRPGTSWRMPGFAGPFELRDDQPVVHVSHHDALEFCHWLNRNFADQSDALPGPGFALPTEAQWEWACRAGSPHRFWWGPDLDTTGKVANVGDEALKTVHPQWPRTAMPMNDGFAFPAPVRNYRANAFGLHDMLGNVWEFCSTRYGPYPKTLDVDPGDLDPQRGFVPRGGGWSNEPVDARCATRNADPPHFCHSNLGFRVALQLPPRNQSRVIHDDRMPYRVHVVEDFETDIEKRWWLRGKVESDGVARSLSKSFPNRRAARSVESLNFDQKMGDQSRQVRAVVFNPVPGPPMGPRTRLAFRYRLHGTDTLQLQIYSLSKNYHRHLILTGLPQHTWQPAIVDMRDARRPDGTGGPLSEDERIDDLQFYVAPDADVSIDDIVLYDAAKDGRTGEPFPRRIIFTGWFDTGQQGREWPGDFEIVPHEAPLTWDAARSVAHPKSGKPFLRIGLRGERTLSAETHLRFRYRLTGSGPLRVEIGSGKTGGSKTLSLVDLITGSWAETTLKFEFPADADGVLPTADEIQFLTENGSELLIDDVLLFEPGAEAKLDNGTK